MIVLIPAYQPDERLPGLIRGLLDADPSVRVVVVDDGSDARCRPVFEAAAGLGATVIGHSPNRGKGFTLKQGFEHIRREMPGEAVVCADCDGQHTVGDIMLVAAALREGDAPMVLGVRAFTGRVPFRSRFGNEFTRWVFELATRRAVHDTQTGLRGYAPEILPWLGTVPGDRFEYELSLLLEAAGRHIPIREVQIETVYLDANASSHFRPLQDSARIMLPLAKFAGSSIMAFGIDTVALLALNALTSSIPLSAIGARAISSSINFATNRSLVFADRRGKHLGVEAGQYWLLVVVLLGANILLLAGLTRIGLSLLVSKVITEFVLFVASFRVQRRFVFARPRGHHVAI